MAVYYSWALIKYVEPDGRANDNYPLICHGDVVWCWDSINDAITYRVEEWEGMWSKGALVLIQYSDGRGIEIKTFSDAACFRCYNEWRKS